MAVKFLLTFCNVFFFLPLVKRNKVYGNSVTAKDVVKRSNRLARVLNAMHLQLQLPFYYYAPSPTRHRKAHSHRPPTRQYRNVLIGFRATHVAAPATAAVDSLSCESRLGPGDA